MKTPSSHRLVRTGTLAAAIATLLATHVAHAASRTWNGNTNANWNTAGNWTEGAWVSGSTAIFGAAGTSGTSLNNDVTAGTSVAGITFNNAADTFTIGGNSIVLGGNITVGTGITAETLDLSITLNNNRTCTVNSGTLTLSGIIGESGGSRNLTKAGVGALTLAAANTFSGSLTLGGGTLNLLHQNAMQYSTLTMNGGASSLVLDNSVLGNAFTVGALAGTSTGAGYDIALLNNAASPAGIALTVGDNNNNTTYAGALSGTGGSLTKTGNGILSLAGTNAYDGGTAVNSGTLSLLIVAALPTSGTTTVAAGAILGLGMGTAPPYFTSADVDTLLENHLTHVSLDDASMVGIDTTAGNFTYTVPATARGVVKLGTNKLTLSGNGSTYGGGTSILGGTLVIGADSDLGSTGTAVNFGNGGLLDTGANVMTLPGRSIILGTGGGGFTTASGGDLTLDTAFGGTGPLNITGSGTVTLGSGITSTLGGLLTVGPSGSSGATLTINNYTLNSTSTATIGNGTGNKITVTGSSSVWNTGSVTVGSGGSGNILTVSSGGKVNVTGAVTVAPYANGSSGHQVNVTGVGSQLIATGAFTISRMSGSSLNISNGGYVKAASHGGSDVASSWVTIDGAGSLYDLTGAVSVQTKQAGPSAYTYLNVTNEGALKSASGTIGNAHAEGYNSTVTIDGTGSLWTNTGTLTIQGNGLVGPNKLTVRNSGQVVGSTSLSVGNGTTANTNSGNSALVQSNGLLQAGTSLTVGSSTSTNSASNTVTANTGGVLQFTSASPTISIGVGADNAINIDGGTLSYKGVTGVDMSANQTAGVGVGKFTWSGNNAFRLDGASETGTAAYSFGGTGTTYSGLELFNAATMSGRAITIDGTAGGTLLLKNATAPNNLGGGVRLAGTVNVTESGTASTLSGVLNGSGALTKLGTGTLTLANASDYSGDTTVGEGTLKLNIPNSNNQNSTVTIASGATLDLDFDELSGPVTDTVDKLYVGTTQMPAGVYGATGSGADAAHTDDTHFAGSGTLTVTSGGGTTPYDTWCVIKGLDGSPGKEKGLTDDPDGDGHNNLAEFAFNGGPLKGSDNGQIYVLQADSNADGDSTKELILTLAVRKNTGAFTAGAPATASSPSDGISYAIEGGLDLSSFGATVTPVELVEPGKPLTDAANYEYRSFSLSGSNGLTGRGFLRAEVTKP
jgi:autotransporter-associated beta strand protein/T5SS/PEP-CTERM-associated repeat protein